MLITRWNFFILGCGAMRSETKHSERIPVVYAVRERDYSKMHSFCIAEPYCVQLSVVLLLGLWN